jgi:hypothetical protein
MRINSSPKFDKLLITCTATHMQLPEKQSVQETQSAQDCDNAIILMRVTIYRHNLHKLVTTPDALLHVRIYCNVSTNITTNDKTNIHLHNCGI